MRGRVGVRGWGEGKGWGAGVQAVGCQKGHSRVLPCTRFKLRWHPAAPTPTCGRQVFCQGGGDRLLLHLRRRIHQRVLRRVESNRPLLVARAWAGEKRRGRGGRPVGREAGAGGHARCASQLPAWHFRLASSTS